jgi:proline iminopeptidase
MGDRDWMAEGWVMSTGLVIVVFVVVLLLLVVALAILVFRRMMGRPMYRPGMVREGKNLRGPLTPPEQPADPEWWAMEEDIRLYHFAEGEGRNVVVVHGGPGFPYRQPWAGLAPLIGEYRFHYYDQRGCGRSTRPFDRFEDKNNWKNIQKLEQTLGIGAQVADLERIRRILGEERLILIGSSFGGLLATLYAAEFPERVEAMVLVAPADLLVMPPPSGGLFEDVGKRLPAEMQNEYQAFLADYFDFGGLFKKSEAELAAMNVGFTKFYRVVYPVGTGEGSDSAQKEIPEQGEPGGWMVQGQYFSLGKRHDYRDALKVIEAPVLVVHGALDLQTEATSRLYADHFVNGRFEVMMGAGHFVYEERPAAFAAVVKEGITGSRN